MGDKIWIPIDDGGSMEVSVDDPRAQAYLRANQRPVVHTVQRGETLSTIAQNAYGNPSTWPRIAAANRLLNPNLILVGQQLIIPQPGENSPIYPASPKKAAPVTPSTGKVPQPNNKVPPAPAGSLLASAPPVALAGLMPANMSLARGFMFVIFEQLPEVGSSSKIIRKVGVIPRDYGMLPITRTIVKMPGVGEILPANPNGLLTPVEHVMALPGKELNSPFLSASNRAMASGSIEGTPLLLDVPKIQAAGGNIITVEQLVAELTQFAAKNPASRTQIDRLIWSISKIEGEVLIRGGVPAGAATPVSTAHMPYIQSAETLWESFKQGNISKAELEQGLVELERAYSKARVFGRAGRVLFIIGLALTILDLGVATRHSVQQNSFKPLGAEVIRQVGGWGGAAAGAKIGFAIGAAFGIETGPGAIATGAVGAMIFGAAGYFGADWIADQISPN